MAPRSHASTRCERCASASSQRCVLVAHPADAASSYALVVSRNPLSHTVPEEREATRRSKASAARPPQGCCCVSVSRTAGRWRIRYVRTHTLRSITSTRRQCAHTTPACVRFRPARMLECAAALPARDKQQRRTALFVTVRSIQPRAAAKAKANAPLPTAEIDRFDSPLPFATLDESNPVRTALSAPHGTGVAHARRVCACSGGTLGSVGCTFQV